MNEALIMTMLYTPACALQLIPISSGSAVRLSLPDLAALHRSPAAVSDQEVAPNPAFLE